MLLAFLTPDMASKNDARYGIEGYPCSTHLFDAMSGIVFWRHVWRQKAAKLFTWNHLPNFGIWAFNCDRSEQWRTHLFKFMKLEVWKSFHENLEAVLTPKYNHLQPWSATFKNNRKLLKIWRLKCRSCAIDYRHEVEQLFDARHGVKKRCKIWHRVILAVTNWCHVWHCFLTPCLASKSFWTLYLQSLAQLRQTSLHMGNWRVVCQICFITYSINVRQLFNARHGIWFT